MHRRHVGLLIGFVSALLLLLLSLFDSSLFGTEWLYYDFLARRLASRTAPDPRIVIVAINDKSIEALEPFFGRPPYSRDLMARVTDEIKNGGAQLVLFDLLFTEENRDDPEGDRNFAIALGSMPTALAANTEEAAGMTPPGPFDSKLWTIEDSRSGVSSFRLIAPIPLLATAEAIGTIRLYVKEKAATNREYGLIEKVQGKRYVPTLALAAAGASRKLPRQGRVSSSLFQNGDLRVPVTSAGTFLIRWHGAKKDPLEISYPVVNFEKVVQVSMARENPEPEYTPEQLGAFLTQSFEGKIVLVALTGAGAASDLRAT